MLRRAIRRATPRMARHASVRATMGRTNSVSPYTAPTRGSRHAPLQSGRVEAGGPGRRAVPALPGLRRAQPAAVGGTGAAEGGATTDLRRQGRPVATPTRDWARRSMPAGCPYAMLYHRIGAKPGVNRLNPDLRMRLKRPQP
jgi:hypothetical protein